ncbi:hypothetical protein EGW08_001960 [Elysia chlorotica]|uniref:Uncharacterized protein n=1 Tax=Elysia chlorotica TaxID=188477 RepID=A0A3S1BKF5_ELYCH|nr:hypothetical protein EGW08_001960 [Elysia chlorotica]
MGHTGLGLGDSYGRRLRKIRTQNLETSLVQGTSQQYRATGAAGAQPDHRVVHVLNKELQQSVRYLVPLKGLLINRSSDKRTKSPVHPLQPDLGLSRTNLGLIYAQISASIPLLNFTLVTLVPGWLAGEASSRCNRGEEKWEGREGRRSGRTERGGEVGGQRGEEKWEGREGRRSGRTERGGEVGGQRGEEKWEDREGRRSGRAERGGEVGGQRGEEKWEGREGRRSGRTERGGEVGGQIGEEKWEGKEGRRSGRTDRGGEVGGQRGEEKWEDR